MNLFYSVNKETTGRKFYQNLSNIKYKNSYDYILINSHFYLYFRFNTIMSCATEVTTPTGKFTFYGEDVSVCEAKKVCAAKGEILAPITNMDDQKALYRVTQEGNHPECPFHYGHFKLYSIGLDVTPCGKGRQDRVFTNGVVWNDTVHGKLYTDYMDSRESPCVMAQLVTISPKPAVVTFGKLCRPTNQRFICLKAAAPSDVVSSGSCASPISAPSGAGNYKGHFVGVLSAACFSLAAVFFAFAAVKYRRMYLSVEEKCDAMKNKLKYTKN